jgi:type II secretory pathway pseudopilin PulG
MGYPTVTPANTCCMKSLSNPRPATELQPTPERRQRDGGYLLLAIMLMMALMVVAATVAAPRYVQQIKRDREEEMIHRGVQYARAIKKFYKKNGRYPASLDDLDKGQIKFLRQRYKDPLAKDGKWKLLNYGDIQMLLNTAAPGTPAASMGTLGGAAGAGGVGSSPFSNSSSPIGFSQSPLQQQQQQQNPGAISGGFASNSDQGGSNSEGPSNNFGSNPSPSSSGFTLDSNNGQSGSSGSNQPGGTNSANGNSASGTNGSNGQAFGGGAIVGVASLSKDPTIRIYNKKKTYNEWQFIYNPIMDQANVLIKGPYQPTTIGAANQIGTPASQMNGQQQQQSPFGQSSSPFGQQNNNSGFGQQNNNNSFGQQNGIGSQNAPQSSPSPQ